MPNAYRIKPSARPTLLSLEVQGHLLLKACTTDSQTQRVVSLQHGDVLSLADNSQNNYKLERALPRSPGDGDEAPMILSTNDQHPHHMKAEMTSPVKLPVTTTTLATWAAGGGQLKKSSDSQECLCVPRECGVGGSGGSHLEFDPHLSRSFQSAQNYYHSGSSLPFPLPPPPPQQPSQQPTLQDQRRSPGTSLKPPQYQYNDSSGLTCTCSHGTNANVKRKHGKEELPGHGKLALQNDSRNYSLPEHDDSSTSSYPSNHHHQRSYRRSISLGQILHPSDVPYSDGFTSAGSTTYPGSSEASPELHTDEAGRELSDFEKENLLFLKDLDNSYHRPLTQSLSNTSLGSTFSEDSLTGDSTPRGGSPYPGRREYPKTAYSPSKTSASKIIRSISREEPEDDLSEGETSQDGRRRREVLGRKISLPILTGRGGNTSDSSAPSSVSSLQGAPAWWNSKQVKEPPPRKYSSSLSSPSTSFNQAKMVFSGRSYSSPADPPSRIPTLSANSVFLQEPPWRKPRELLPTGDVLGNLEDTNRKSNPETVEAASVTSPATRPVSLASTTTSTTTTTTTTAVSTNSPTTTTTTTTSNHNSPRDGGAEDLSNSSGGEASADIKKPSPMAFTIELGNTTSGGVETPAKKLDITASISKWAPKHRRNLSLTKVEENKVVENFFDENGNSRPKRRSTISRLDKVEERIGKPPVGRPRSGTIGATGLMQTQGRRAGGYHSEGYFSSDQDDEIPRRTDLKSPRSPRTPELRSPQTPQRVVRSSSQDSAKGASLKKSAGKPEGRTCCKSDKKPTVAEVTGRAKSEKGTKSTSKMTPEARKQSNSANSLSSCQTYDVKQELEGNVPGKEEKDDVSEAGTYTIEKDSSSPEVEQARNDIDRVFGVSGTESETEITPRANMQPDETWTATPEPDKFKSPGSLSRNSPNWIQQWAAQVAEHTKSPDTSSKISLASPRGLKPPMASLSSSQESSESRPRRKLPTPPTHHSPFALTSPRASDMSDHESPTKGSKHRRELYETPCGGQHESSFNTESFLRETEQLVTSLQARVDMNKGISPGLRGSSFESRDSGGDSDLDTSTSYPINDDDDHLMKTVGLQLKTKLKLSGIGDASKTPPVVASPRKNDPLGLETRLKLANNFKRERSIVSDSGYEVYANRREENSLQSDSSSEASEPVKDSRKTIDNNPPLKFNRAFSLRRARLTCDDSSQQHQSPSPLDKKKNTRPVTSGNLSGNRKVPLGSSKSHQNHQSSDSTRGGSHSHIPTSKGGSTDFSRGDGGRFSLRLPRSGSSNTVSKSPSHSSVRKELSSNSRRGTPRSNSTLSAKEVDFQNWKRRKNYDPMKAAAEGRKKVTDKKSDKTNQCHSLNAPERGTPSPPGSLLRSASFHGTEGMAVSGRWPRRPNHLYTSEDDGPYSLEEEHPRRVPNCSPLRRSPTSPHQLASPHTTSPARQATLAAARARRSSFTHSDEGEGQPASPNRKTSLDESGSEGKRSPMGSTRGTVSSRSKAKMEALDNLVISTIHSLSVKVRTTSETLLQKLKSQYDEEGDRAALLEEVLAHLSESDQTLVTGQSRSTSRELAGILRNLKKIEHALEVIDRVMVCDDEDDLDEDDLDGTVGQEWGSDY